MLPQHTEMHAANSEIIDQMHNFNENVEKLQFQLTVDKQVNSLLSKRLVSLERQFWANAQYGSVYIVVLVTVNWRK